MLSTYKYHPTESDTNDKLLMISTYLLNHDYGILIVSYYNQGVLTYVTVFSSHVPPVFSTVTFLHDYLYPLHIVVGCHTT